MVTDLNLDLGEFDGDAAHRRDLHLLAYATRINVACGFHAGDEQTMRALCAAAADRGVLVGAHISYRDREHFGRRQMDVGPEQLADEAADQIRTLARIAAECSAVLSHVKPHGALYHRLVADQQAARSVAEAIAAEGPELAVLTMPDAALAAEAAALGLPVLREGFADRSYVDVMRLAPREHPAAVLDPEHAADQARALATAATLTTADGTPLTLAVDTICVHGDGARALDVARAVHRAIIAPTAPLVRTAGSHAVLVELAGARHPAEVASLLRREWATGLVDVVPGHETVLARFSTPAPPVAAVAAVVGAGVPGAAGGETAAAPIVLPVRYDGADLNEIATSLGLSPEGLIARHGAAGYRVAFVGFLPGFAYLVGDDPALQVPRHAEPRPQVPAGSVGLGGEYCGIYPREAPGGWQLLGTTTAALFDPDRAPPALLEPGTPVRFEAVPR